MFFSGVFRFFLIFFTFSTWGLAMAAPLRIYDENRILSAPQTHYLKNLAQELEQKTGFSLAIVLLDDNGHKRDIPPNDNELLLYTSFKQQLHFVKFGTNLDGFLSKAVVEKYQQEYLFPEYKSARYDKGTLLLAYHLSKELAEKKGVVLTIEPPESEPKGSLNTASWIFVSVVFSLLFFTLYKRGRRTRIATTYKRFRYGQFGWRKFS